MIFDALELAYTFVRRFQERQADGSPRMNPAIVISLVVAPVIFAVLTLSFGSGGRWGDPLGIVGRPNLTVLSLLAFAIASIVVAIGIDRRRAAIDAKFTGLSLLEKKSARVLAGLGIWLMIGIESVLANRQPFACVAFFLLVCLGGSLLLRKISGRSQ